MIQSNSNRIPVNRKLLTRFFSKIKIDPAITFNGSACWLWTASTTDGYGMFSLNGRTSSAHRFAFAMFVHVIERGREADHLCRVRNCVNPAHLEDTTHKVNTLRGYSASAINARKTQGKTK